MLVAESGERALEIVEGQGVAIDLMLTDVVMPRMSGRELAERVTAMQPRTKVIFMSSYTDDALIRHGVRHAELEFVQKPFKPDDLIAKVMEVLSRRCREAHASEGPTHASVAPVLRGACPCLRGWASSRWPLRRKVGYAVRTASGSGRPPTG